MVRRQYWSKVYRESVNRTKESNKIFKFFRFIIITGMGFGFHWLCTNRAEAMNELLIILIYAVVAVVVGPIFTFLYHFLREPAISYEKTGGLVGEPIILSPERHPEFNLMGEETYWRGLTVRNITPFDVEECMLRLMSAINMDTRESIIRRDENLLWSDRDTQSKTNEEKKIPGKLSSICNIAAWYKKASDETGKKILWKQAVFSLAFGKQQLIPTGDYKCSIRIKGKWKGLNFNYLQEIDLSYDGKRILLNDERNINE